MITTKSRYALRAVLDIARHQGDGVVRRADIAERQLIPPHYLERILLRLRNQGIVESRKGPRGGFRLQQAPDQLTAWSVIEAMGEGRPPMECLHSATPGCGRHEECSARLIWAHLYCVVREEMEAISLVHVLDGRIEDSLNKDLESIIKACG